MASRIVLTGATGKIGGAVLDAILTYGLALPTDLVVATSSDSTHPKLEHAVLCGVEVRPSNYDSIDLMARAFAGCDRLFLVSTPRINLDFHDAAQGGREIQHFNALEAARRAGIKHVYYTSLAFSDPSKAAVMRAHLKTEEHIKSQNDFEFTILREGLYNESWPLYLGHYKVPNDERSSVVIGHDGLVCWTAIYDLGLANALIVTGNQQEWSGKTIYLSAKRALKLVEIAEIVGRTRGMPLSVEVSSQQRYIEHYTREQAMDYGQIEWWSSTYAALPDGESRIDDSPLEELLASKGRKPIPIEETIASMFKNI